MPFYINKLVETRVPVRVLELKPRESFYREVSIKSPYRISCGGCGMPLRPRVDRIIGDAVVFDGEVNTNVVLCNKCCKDAEEFIGEGPGKFASKT